MGAGTANYIANFTTQHFLSMGANTTPDSGFFDAGQTIQITNLDRPGCTFLRWHGTGNGSYSGTDNPATIVMNGPITEIPEVFCNPSPTPTATPTATPTMTPFVTPSPLGTATPIAGQTLISFASQVYTDDESQTAQIEIRRSFQETVSAGAQFTTISNTAIGGESCDGTADYINTTQNISFAPGETSKFVTITICSDNLVEDTEIINLKLIGNTRPGFSDAFLLVNDTASQYQNTSKIIIAVDHVSQYPSIITVQGAPTEIGSVRVTLYDLSHSVPDALALLLVGPQGQKFILMANAGGFGPTFDATFTFQDGAGSILPDNGPIATGKYEPTSWVTPVTSFHAPAPPGPYSEPGNTIGGTGTETLFGNFGDSDPNGTWRLYPRVQGAGAGQIRGGWGLEFLAPPTAQASISGRVTTADGIAIRSAEMVLTGNSLETPLRVSTSSFGYFTFDGLQIGETYVLTVNSRRFTFFEPSRVISLTENGMNVEFIADQITQ